MSLRAIGLGVCAAALCACATQDHFYNLSVLPAASRDAQVVPRINVLLSVTVPSLVDRSEMVLNTSPNGIEVLEHERWAAPFADQVAQALGRDIERHRSDILVADQRFVQETVPPISLQVDLGQITVQRAGRATMEAHWRIVSRSTGVDQMGGGTFDTPVVGSDYAAIARALSETLGALAERLSSELPR